MRILGYSIAALFGIFALSFIARGMGLISYTFWAPKEQTAKRKVFEETPSFVHGKLQLLTKYKLDWTKEQDPTIRAGICSAARHEAST